MPTVIRTDNSTVDDVFETFIAEARTTMDDYGLVEKTFDRTTLPKNAGRAYNEPKLSRTTAARWNEGEPHPEATLTSTNLHITPYMSGLKVPITRRHMEMANENYGAKLGQAIGQALAVFKDTELITNFDTFTAELPGAGSAFTLGGARAAAARIFRGSGEPYKGNELFGILHSYQMHDLLESVGNYSSGNPTNADPGIPADLLKNYEVTRLAGITFTKDDNIAADGSDDAKGGIYARQAVRLIDFNMPDTYKEENKDTGTWIFYGDQDFGHGIYVNAWGVCILSDVTAPTS